MQVVAVISRLQQHCRWQYSVIGLQKVWGWLNSSPLCEYGHLIGVHAVAFRWLASLGSWLQSLNGHSTLSWSAVQLSMKLQEVSSA